MVTLSFQDGNKNLYVEAPTLQQIEQCIDALDNWDHSTIRISVEEKVFLINGGDKNGLVHVLLYDMKYRGLRLVDPELFASNSDEETIIFTRYEDSEMPIKYLVSKALANKAAQFFVKMGKPASELYWFHPQSRNLLHGSMVEN